MEANGDRRPICSHAACKQQQQQQQQQQFYSLYAQLAPAHGWEANRGGARQALKPLGKLNEVYACSCLVLSARVHVLILFSVKAFLS